MVRDNWEHYRTLYGIDRSTYRNDFALSIALGIVSGHTNSVTEIPWPLLSALPDTVLTQQETDYYSVSYRDTDNRNRFMGWHGTDFHAMGKRHLENIIASH